MYSLTLRTRVCTFVRHLCCQVHRLHVADDVQLPRVRLGEDHWSPQSTAATPPRPGGRTERTLPGIACHVG